VVEEEEITIMNKEVATAEVAEVVTEVATITGGMMIIGMKEKEGSPKSMVVTEEEEATTTEADTIIEEEKVEGVIEEEIKKVVTKAEIGKEEVIEVVIRVATTEMTEKVVMTLIGVVNPAITKGREKLGLVPHFKLSQMQKMKLTYKCKVTALNWFKADLRKLRQEEVPQGHSAAVVDILRLGRLLTITLIEVIEVVIEEETIEAMTEEIEVASIDQTKEEVLKVKQHLIQALQASNQRLS